MPYVHVTIVDIIENYHHAIFTCLNIVDMNVRQDKEPKFSKMLQPVIKEEMNTGSKTVHLKPRRQDTQAMVISTRFN